MRKIILKPAVFFLPLVFALFACTVDGESSRTLPDESVETNMLRSPMSRQVYYVLLGELYGKSGDIDKSLFYYMKLVKENSSPEIARRVTALAARTNNNKDAMEAAEQWVKANNDSVDAHQYLALLNIRTNKPKAAAKELLWIQQYLDKKNKHGFAFVASLVSFESNKKSAYKAFKLFAKQSGKPDEASLALAALAMNAGKFEEVLKAVAKSRKSSDPKIRDRANIIYAKAMMNLEREDEAIKELKPIAESSQNANLKLEYARLLVLAGKYQKAEALFKALYQQAPNNTDILYTLGLLNFDMKKYEKARPFFEKLVNSPNAKRADEAQYFLGQIYEKQDSYDKAFAAYTKAEDTEYFQEAEISKAKLILNKKGVDAAREYLSSKIASTDSDEESIALLLVEGQILYQKKMYDEALKSYQKILEIAPDDFDGLYSRSLVYSQMGDIKNAEKDLKKILSKTPENVTALNALGYSLAVYTTRFDEAKKYIAKALKIKPDDPAIIDSMGWVEYRSGHLRKAEHLLRKAYKKLPDTEVASHLVEVLAKRGKQAEARKLLSEMLKKHAEDENLLAVQKKLANINAQN